MDTPTAKRIVIGSMALVVLTAEVRRIRKGDGPTLAPPIGGLAAAATLVLVAGPAPQIAATFALIALVGELAVDVSDPHGSALFAAVNNATNPKRKAAAFDGLGAGVNKAAEALSAGVARADGTRWWTSSSGLSGLMNGSASTIATGVADATGTGMVKFTSANGQTITCAPSVQGPLSLMIAAAKADGIILKGGCWRSSKTQAELRRKNGCPDLTSPSSTCRIPTAPVGHSQHELGLAIDFDGIPKAGGGKAHAWLTANAGRFGFYQLPSEGWHWSTTGK